MIDGNYDMEELLRNRARIVWFKKPDVERLVPCMRFGLRVNRTLAEMLEERAEGLTQIPATILNALLMIIRYR